MLVEAFNMAISKGALATFVCASCSGKYLVKNKRILGLDEFDINLLRRPDYVDPDYIDPNESDGEDGEDRMDVDTDVHLGHSSTGTDTGCCPDQSCSHHAQSPSQNPWLDPDCVPPPMPFPDDESSGNLAGALVDPDGIESGDTGEPVLAVCKDCHPFLKRGKVPRLAIANYNFLGPVPDELDGLTVVEEAMIARCMDYPTPRGG